MEENNTGWGTLIFIIMMAIGYYFYTKFSVKESWDLMVCKTLMENGADCYENSYTLKGYKTQNECMEKGLLVAKKEGFECGKNCKPDKEYGGIRCEIICNKGGCN